ncbi:hypothetical protein LUZ62_070596 [Rhynchospora pubera]|uniref:Uncharacterized protein n=1 Tax=Rhynchospora pubera TaxID=906938 RepID=A0AAV8CXZ3_9POAL|nr:hypothetical protein LUZ62_070596 [Rhynchospora pubera]
MRCASNRIWSGSDACCLVSLHSPVHSSIILSPSLIFNWMFNKPHGRQEASRRGHSSPSLACHMSIPSSPEEEFIEWPESLLSIGTFGTNTSKEVKNGFTSDNKIVEQDLSDHTYEVATLLKELEKMGLERGNLAEYQFMDCSTSLTDPNCEDYENIFNKHKIVLSKGRDLSNNTESALKKRSISFLLKKVFACRGGFAPVPAPGLRDPFSQPRMEKLLKSILRKKIYPQNTAPMPTKYLQKKYHEKLSIEQTTTQEKGDDGEKWVKTDSDFIVLEI